MISSLLRALLLVGGLSFCAVSTKAGVGWYTDYVRHVYPMADGSFVLSFMTSPSGCLNTSNPKYFYVRAGASGVTTDGVKAMLATALMAFASGKRLQVAFDDASVNCDINRLLVMD